MPQIPQIQTGHFQTNLLQLIQVGGQNKILAKYTAIRKAVLLFMLQRKVQTIPVVQVPQPARADLKFLLVQKLELPMV